MHGKLRHTRIHGTNPSIRRDNRSNGTSTRTIIPNHKFLGWGDSRLPRDLTDDESSHTVRAIPLILVGFDYHPLIHEWGVILFMLCWMIGVLRNSNVKSTGERHLYGMFISEECTKADDGWFLPKHALDPPKRKTICEETQSKGLDQVPQAYYSTLWKFDEQIGRASCRERV